MTDCVQVVTATLYNSSYNHIAFTGKYVLWKILFIKFTKLQNVILVNKVQQSCTVYLNMFSNVNDTIYKVNRKILYYVHLAITYVYIAVFRLTLQMVSMIMCIKINTVCVYSYTVN